MQSEIFKKIVIAILLLFFSTGTYAEQATTPELPTLFGISITDTQASLSLTNSVCRGEENVNIKAREILVIGGIKTCTPNKSGSVPVNYYAIGYRGQLRYIPQDDVVIRSEEKTKLESATEADMLLMQEAAKEKSDLLYKTELKDALNKLNKTKPSGIAILHSSIADTSEYTEGTSLTIKYYNPTAKVIKYITASIVGYNAVGDPVRAPFNRQTTITLRGIGPIEPEGVAVYKDEYAWHTDLVETFKITKLKVQYMDGSISTVKNPKLVTLDRQSYELLYY